MAEITVTVDGVKYPDEVEPRMLLVHYLRDRLGKTGTPIGCDTSNCGACTVHARRAVGEELLGARRPGRRRRDHHDRGPGERRAAPVQQAFHEEHALQCGYCTPGMIMAAVDLLRENPDPSDDEIRDGLEGNLCRCTGYQNIVRAVPARRAGAECSDDDRAPTETPEATNRPSSARPRLRKEDARLITGQTSWTDNIQLPGHAAHGDPAQPVAHARITPVDVSAARTGPASSPPTPARTSPTSRAALPCAWPVTDGHRASRRTRRWPSTRSATSARPSPSSSPATATPPPTRSRPIEVDYEPLPAGARHGGGAAEDAPPGARRQGTNKCFTWSFDRRATSTRPSEATPSAWSIERRYVQQRLIPTRDGAARGGRATAAGGEFTLWSVDPDPAHPAGHAGADRPASPSTSMRVIAPDVGGGFGSKLQVTAEEVLGRAGRPQAGPAGQVDRVAQRGQHGRAPRPRPDPGLEIAADRDGTILGLDVDLLADMGAYLQLVTPGVPLLGAFMFNAIYKLDALPVRAARACSPTRCRPTPTAAPAGPRRRTPSSGSWTSSPPSWAWTRWSCARRTGSSTRSSRSPRSPG